MRRLPLLPLLTALLLAALPRPAAAESRVALVLGNGAYRSIAALPNPENDARAMAASLERLGFQVTAVYNGDKRAMDEAVRGFGQRVPGADVAMVFYAGHGVQVQGRNYLVPVDAKPPAREQDLRYDFIDLAGVMDELADARKLRVVVLDACRDNPIAAALSRSLGRAVGAGRGLAVPTEADNTLIAYATAADATASDGQGAHSPFTTALLDHIADPGLDIRLMFGRVRDDVRRATANQQNPFVYASLGGDSFAFNPGAAAAPSPPPPAPRPEGLAAVARPVVPVPVPLPAAPLPAAPRAPDLAALLAGRWRFSDGAPCGAARYGTVTLLDGALRFEWRLPGGRVNVAIERITAAEGNVLTTTVVSDVGTPRPEVGNRNRYVIEDGSWQSLSLTTGERAAHGRC